MTKVKISPIEETLEIEETSQDETEEPSIPSPIEIPEVKQKRSRKKQEPTPQTEEPAKIKKGKMIACNVCGKELLEKTFKYYHQLKCKPKQEIQEPIPQPKPEAFVVNFDFPRRTQRSEKYVSLISKAF
jgi:hypothetical protein